MNRTISYDIDSHSEGLRVEQFLRRKGYSAQNLSTIKRMPESILVNGVHYYMKQALKSGDHLLVRIQETESSRNIPPVCAPLSVVYEDEDLIVVNKPAGMPIHPSLNNYTNSLANALAWYYQQQGKPFIFRCCNRLDRDTSGLTVVAKHLVSGNILSTMTKKKEVRREYLAVVRGHIIPETGRTHQIRIHLKHLGFPLVGDYLYNPDMEYISRQALHSFRLSFPHPITGEVMDFTAPLPEDMRNILTERSSLR